MSFRLFLAVGFLLGVSCQDAADIGTSPACDPPCAEGYLCDTSPGGVPVGQCVESICGNGTREGSEACDAGVENSNTQADACREDCTPASCGDAVVDTGEDCDNGGGNSNTAPDACRSTCAVASCGDGVTDSGESCDDGDAEDTDACGSDCLCSAGYGASEAGCDALVCGEDQHVANNLCEDCAPGTTNRAGDSASGEDTECDATLCGENQHVLNHVCSPCVDGTTNQGGDSASGEDTLCDTIVVSGHFKMIFSADPQVHWSWNSQSQDGDHGRDKDRVAKDTNLYNVFSMLALNARYPEEIKGVVINGDLTAYGDVDELADYVSWYPDKLEPAGLLIYPGLGNHDYENNIKHCEGFACLGSGSGAWNNLGADRMIDYLREWAGDYGVPLDWVQDGSDSEGSLAYSFDEGDIHFIQLHNYPSYTVRINKDPFSDDVGTIQSSLPWLINDLQDATAIDQKIVINYHDYSSDGESGPFMRVLDDYGVNVVAIFVGHWHSLINFGEEINGYWDHDSYELFAGRRMIPVFLCGSAIYQRYLLASFEGDVMKIQTVDSAKTYTDRRDNFEGLQWGSYGESDLDWGSLLGPVVRYDISLPTNTNGEVSSILPD